MGPRAHGPGGEAVAEEKEAAYAALVARKVPISQVGQVAAALWRPGQATLLAPYADRYLENLPTLDRGGMIPAMVFTHWLLPMFGIDEAYLDRAQRSPPRAPPRSSRRASPSAPTSSAACSAPATPDPRREKMRRVGRNAHAAP